MVKKTKPTEDNRRGYLAPLVLDIKKISRPLLGKKGFTSIDIITNWQSLVGDKIASFATPLKLTFPHGKTNSGVLHISVAGGVFATELTHKKLQLLEKINTYFGYAAVSGIKIIQDSYPLSSKKGHEILQNATIKDGFAKEKTLSPRMQEIISEIHDPDLKETLTNLAELF